MIHEPAAQEEKDPTSEWKAKLGIKLFWLYCIIYMGFVALAVFATQTLKTPVLSGVNLAIIYGMALILLAIVLGLIYNYFCSKKEREMGNGEPEE